MLILAFDPGDSTGFAVVDEKGDVKTSGMFTLETMSFWMDFLKSNYDITQVVIEASPFHTRKGDISWDFVKSTTKKIYPEAKFLDASPGFWKPLRHLLSHEGDTFGSDHEKDAVYLGRFRARMLMPMKMLSE